MLFFPFGILQLISIVVPFGVLSNRSWCKNKVKVATIPVTSHCKSDMVRYDLLSREWVGLGTATRTVRLQEGWSSGPRNEDSFCVEDCVYFAIV